VNRGHVTLVEIVAAAASRATALVPESAGYLVLSLCDAIGCLPVGVDGAAVLVSTEGTVSLAHKGPAQGGPEAARAMREIFARLLEVATGSTAALAAAARRRPAGGERGLEAVAAEIEAALVPVNRAAGKRTLARLSRETARALEAGLVDPRALSMKRAREPEQFVASVKIIQPSPVVAAEPDAEPEPTDVMTVGPVSELASSSRPEPSREATPTVPDPGWIESIPAGSIRIPVEIPASAVHTLRTGAAAPHAPTVDPDPQALSRTFLQHVLVDETAPSQGRSHTGPLGTVLGGVDLSGSLGGADVVTCTNEPSLTPPPASVVAHAPASAPVAPAPPRRDRTDDLLDRFGRSPEAEAALMRATARNLKALAGLDPTPPPLAPTRHIPAHAEDRSPAWLPPQPRTETELAPSPLVPAPRKLRGRIALSFALLVAVVAGASAIVWTHPELFPWRSDTTIWGALDLP
jgi:hypothetical protein